MPSAAAGKNLFFWALLAVTLAPFALILALAPHAAQLPGFGGLVGLTGGGHVGSTLYIFADSEFRPLVRANPLRFIVAPLALAIVFAFVLEGLPTLWPAVYAAILCWQLYHYQRQSFGIVAFAARAQNIRLPKGFSAALNLTVVAGMLGILASGTMLELPVGAWAPQIRLAGVAVYAVALVWLATMVVRDAQVCRSPSVIVAIAAAALFFLPALLPGDVLVVFWTYAIAHGAQYLIFMVALAWNAPRRSSALCSLTGAAMAVTMLGGLGVLTAARASPLWQAVYAGLLCGHFLIDAKVWRLREMPQRALIGRRFGFALAPPAPGARGSIVSGEIGADGRLPLAARLGAGPG